ncbi:MAG: VOC family protein [Acidobacteriota bacterium]|nr:VOC family protein [Acidobacteriota bacterium]
MTSDNTLPGRSIMPSLTVNDLKASETFFTALGFEIEDRWEHDGKLVGLMIKAGEARLGLSQDDGKKGLDRVKGVGVRIYIEADGDLDAVAARAKAAGVTLQREPHDTEWGARAFEVIEPSGFLLTIASPAKS